VNYLAVAPEHRGKGHGRQLMRHVEERLTAIGCPKLNMQVRADNKTALEFYRKLGYSIEERVSLGKRLIPDA
jgi:ribosomal protein S18 acetylase RimI-like enzyme